MSGDKTQTFISQPAPTPEEIRINQLLVAQLERQAEEQEFLDSLITREQRRELAQEQFERARRLGPLEEELTNIQLEAIRRGPAATPEQLALIGTATERAIAAGESDIGEFSRLGLRQIGRELAPSLGLRPTDTPILDRGGEVLRETARQQGQLVRNLRQAEATAALNFPIAAGQFQAAQTQFQQGLVQAASQFQAQLRQQAFQNRLRLSGSTAQGLGAIQAPRLAATGVVGSSSTDPFGNALAGGLGAAGAAGIAGGIGGALGGTGFAAGAAGALALI